MTYYLFGVIAFGGRHSGGGETPGSVSINIEHGAEITFKKKLPARRASKRP